MNLTVISRTGERGKATGKTRHCQLHGCNGVRVGVRWPDGKITWPCTKGMQIKKNTAQIQ